MIKSQTIKPVMGYQFRTMVLVRQHQKLKLNRMLATYRKLVISQIVEALLLRLAVS